MTPAEYQAWLEAAKRSAEPWDLDAVMLANSGTFLYFKGGEAGHFIKINSHGFVELGTYSGAWIETDQDGVKITRITDAKFTRIAASEYGSVQAAHKAVIDRGGVTALRAFYEGPDW